MNNPLAQHDPGGPADSAAASVSDALGRTAEPTAPPVRRGEILRRPSVFLPLALVLLVCSIALFPRWFAGWFGHGDPRACNLIDSSKSPTSGHPFGFDLQGCDLYANVIYGARASLAIALIVTFSCLVVAVLLGSLAGYYRGRIDAVISRVMDVFFGFPALVGMIILLNSMSVRSVWTVAAVIALFAWPPLTRVFRASVLSVSTMDYVQASREIGAGHTRVLVRHVIPNSIGPLAAILSLSIGGIITAEAGLTFLGVGLKAPTISWGVQLNTAQRYFTTDLHLLIFPSLFLTVTVLAFVTLGDGLRDALDPKAN